MASFASLTFTLNLFSLIFVLLTQLISVSGYFRTLRVGGSRDVRWTQAISLWHFLTFAFNSLFFLQGHFTTFVGMIDAGAVYLGICAALYNLFVYFRALHLRHQWKLFFKDRSVSLDEFYATSGKPAMPSVAVMDFVLMTATVLVTSRMVVWMLFVSNGRI